ncbi:aldehyde dehydrogenase [Aspergillus candidus]|uniref:Aldehyde dehydrogenase n=1 Tax=Aspergillus candidus TaxID=41067 RepID=A0A2I2F5T4_ASPCN|nr:aldehyde dehydrogenase [Aspergillus candidus]PLB35973.1 aldehyde dehydrogenase [Aspergillus candidus]
MEAYTSIPEVDLTYKTLQTTFRSGRTKELAWRKWQLKQVWWLVEDNQQRIIDALNKDMNRHAFETTFADCMTVKTDVVDHLKNIDKWAADQPVDANMVMKALLRPCVRPEPLGVALIIGPWNFPVSLVLQPMVAAIAAGCAVLIKPSEITLACQALLVELIPKYMDPSAVRIVTGGPTETTALLERKFDHIFFTGSVGVARHVARAAAKHLTPTVLELGGQCPAIVTKSADVDAAARDIAWAKYLNSGQICLSVNHVFAHPDIQAKLIERMAFYFAEYAKNGADEMTHIVNQKNYERLKGLIEKTQGKIECGGTLEASKNRIAPSVVSGVTMNDSLLSEELFGTICPVLTASTEEAVAAINDHVISSTISGGVTVNGTIIHSSVPSAPFGGVGDSGHGYYHGKHGFQAFTHLRTIARPVPLFGRLVSFLRPPYSVNRIKWIGVRQNLGIRRGWTLDDERRIARQGNLLRLPVRFFQILAFIVTLGLVDHQMEGQLGIIQRLQGLTDLIRNIF